MKNAFDLSRDDIEAALRYGSGFAQGKLRIYALYAQNPTPKEAAEFLKDEYGIGGRSWMYLDGSSGFVDYSAKGMTFSRNGFTEEAKCAWAVIEQIMRGLIDTGAYMSVKDEDALSEVIQNWGCLPMPTPCHAYPPAVTFVTPEEFLDMIPEAITPEEFLDGLPDVA